MIKVKNIILLLLFSFVISQKVLIPMDEEQNDHLKAYGIAFLSLKNNNTVNWLLNYRGGSFLLDLNNNMLIILNTNFLIK